jgi:hypothetical protein
MSPRHPAYAARMVGLALMGSLTLAGCGGGHDDAASKAPCGLTDTRKGHLTVKTAPAALEKAAEGRKTVSFRQELTRGKHVAAIEGVADSSPDKIYGLEQTMPGDDGTVKLIIKGDKVYVSAEGSATASSTSSTPSRRVTRWPARSRRGSTRLARATPPLPGPPGCSPCATSAPRRWTTAPPPSSTTQRPRMLAAQALHAGRHRALGHRDRRRLASSALSRLRMSVISAGLTWRPSLG